MRARYYADPVAARDYLREQYAKHAEKRRAARRARYWANLGPERAAALKRMTGRKPPEATLRVRRAMRYDDRWAGWAKDIQKG